MSLLSLQEKIASYVPPKSAVELVKANQIALLAGISGAGKDTVKGQLLDGSDDYREIVTHTTRQPRINNGQPEQDGVDYHFVTPEQMEDLLDRQAFIEVKNVHETVYGSTMMALESIYQASKIAVTAVDVQGVDEYKELSSDVVAIFVLPPNFTVWRQRFRRRYDSDEAFETEFSKRSKTALGELISALDVPYYHFIINDDLERTIRVADEIARRGESFNRHDDEARLAARDLLQEIEANLAL